MEDIADCLDIVVAAGQRLGRQEADRHKAAPRKDLADSLLLEAAGLGLPCRVDWCVVEDQQGRLAG